jgi:hypothetical protein
MYLLWAAAYSDTGPLEPGVKAAGWLVSAIAAIGLGWRGRTNWEPTDESVRHGAAKVSGLLAAIGLALLWTQLASADHQKTLVVLTAAFAVLCLLSLLGYGYVIGTKVFDKEETTGPSRSRTLKLVGGFRLTTAASKALEQRPGLTVQELFRVWLFWSDVGGRVLMRPVPRTGRAAWH